MSIIDDFLEDCRHDAEIYRRMAELYYAEEEIVCEVEEILQTAAKLEADGSPESIARTYAYLDEKSQGFIPALDRLNSLAETAGKR